MLVSKFFTIYFLDLSTVHHCIIHLNVYALQEQGLITMAQLLACLSCSYSHHRQTIRNLLLSLSPMNPPAKSSSIYTNDCQDQARPSIPVYFLFYLGWGGGGHSALFYLYLRHARAFKLQTLTGHYVECVSCFLIFWHKVRKLSHFHNITQQCGFLWT